MDDKRIPGGGRPAGAGPEILESFWPDQPVLLLGAKGTGRTTWANYLMTYHGAPEELIFRSDTGYEQDCNYIFNELFIHPYDIPRWASINIEYLSHLEQGKIALKAEKIPENCRLILRGRLGHLKPTPFLRSRCFTINVKAPTLQETIDILVSKRVRLKEAEEIAELRPGQPGLALEFLPHLPYRGHFNGILNAIQSRDHTALATALIDCPESIRVWFKEWIKQKWINNVTSHIKLMNEISPELLEKAYVYLLDVPNPRMAVKAAATLLIVR